MNRNRSSWVLALSLCFVLPTFAANSPGYQKLQDNVKDNIENGSYVPSPRLLWSDTCDGVAANCLQPDTTFNSYKTNTTPDAVTKSEPENWKDPYDPSAFGQSPEVSGSTSDTTDYKWWYEK